MLQRYFRVQSATLQVEWLSPLSVSVQHLDTTYQSLAPPLHTTPWSVNEILSTTVVDAEPGTQNQTHKLNSKFIGPFVCARQLWIQSFSKQTMQITEFFLKCLDSDFRFNESSSFWGSHPKKKHTHKLSPHCPLHAVLLAQWQGKIWSQLAHDLLGKIAAPK